MPGSIALSMILLCDSESLVRVHAVQMSCMNGRSPECESEGTVAPRSLIMEKSSKRGKIPQSDWPLIMARYDSGETLASIARTYDCSPPAISYVVSRSRARQPDAEISPPAPSATAPQLIKAAASEPTASSNAQAPAASASPANGHPGDHWPG